MNPVYLATAAVLAIVLVAGAYLAGTFDRGECTVTGSAIELAVPNCEELDIRWVPAYPGDPAGVVDAGVPVSLSNDDSNSRGAKSFVPELPDGWTDYLVTGLDIVCVDESETTRFEFGYISDQQPDSGTERATESHKLDDVKGYGRGCGELERLIPGGDRDLVLAAYNISEAYLQIINRTAPAAVE